MTDRRAIVELWKGGQAAALVTLVRVEGSSYRRPGARLLIGANGDYAGSISGGCLEAEVIRKAEWLARNGAAVQRYSTLFDDTAEIPYGLGCGGTVDLLIEPAGTREFTLLMQALETSLGGQTVHVLTTLPSAVGGFTREITARPEVQNETAFAETLHPPQRLVLFGAGDDAQPMVRLAALMGWNVEVVDTRPQWARSERFPSASHVGAEPSQPVSRQDAVVLMTHSYEQDRAALVSVLRQQPLYAGLLGARHRSALLLNEAANLLGWPLARVCEIVWAPVGLDLGGDGAEAIALSTVAEIQACLQGKLERTDRLTPSAVQQQLTLGGSARYEQAQCAV